MRRLAPAPRPRPLALLAALAGGAVLAAGCGSDDEAATSPAGALSQEQYVAEVRGAIRPVAAESQELRTQANEARQVEDLAEPLGDAESAYQSATDQLESLEPPAEVEGLHERLVDAQQDIANATRSARQAAKRGDRKGLRRFREAGDQYRERAERLSEQFSELGFEL